MWALFFGCPLGVSLEDFPGSGKTTLAKALGEAIESEVLTTKTTVPFRRIQFTPDLLPSDVTGVSIFDVKTEFVYLIDDDVLIKPEGIQFTFEKCVETV